MGILFSTWACYFTAFFLACLGCGLLLRRGFVPLHLSALVGISAFIFTAFCGKVGLHPILAAVIALIVVMGASALIGLIFLRMRGTAAALATISVQIIFDRYVATAEWTGASTGIWQGIPILSPGIKVVLCVLAIIICSSVYAAFQRTNASRLLIADGFNPLLVASTVPSLPITPLIVSNLAVGLCAGCAGLVFTLQTGFVSPTGFSLNWGLLYAGTILLVGWQNLGAIAIGAFILTLLPEILRYSGLGQSNLSAWRGFIVGVVIALVVWVQFPRMVAVNKYLRKAA